ncbi:MAG: hypothetical protein IJJ29_01150 [Solobacterium sp.]|nr:hypothetical protein [Solobacterium sp.]
MKKKVLAVSIAAAVLTGCAASPRDMLIKAYEKNTNMSSAEIDGTLTISASAEGLDLEVPIDLTLIFDTHEEKDKADDETYVKTDVSLLGNTFTQQMWMKDGMMYTDDGTHKIKQEYSVNTDSTLNIDPEKFVDGMFESLESAKISKDGDDRVLTLTLNKENVLSLLNDLVNQNRELEESADVIDLFEGIDTEALTFHDIEIRVGKDDYINKVSLGADIDFEGTAGVLNAEFTVRDRNSAVIPAYDPAEFADGYVVDDLENEISSTDTELNVSGEEDESEAYVDDYSVNIWFDDGSEYWIRSPEDQGTFCYFDENDQQLYFFTEKDMLASGIFLNKDSLRDYLGKMAQDEESYTLHDITVIGEGITRTRGCAKKDTEILKEGTPYAGIIYEDRAYGFLMVGYGSEEDFIKLTDAIDFGYQH